MRNLLTLLFSILLAYCICSSYVLCAESNELLKDDLALPSNVQLKDDDYEIVQIWQRDFKSGDDNMKQLRFRRATNASIDLTMKETSIIREKTPVYLIYSDSNITLADDNIVSDAVKFYEEPTLFLSFATGYDKYGHPYFLGSVTKGTVRPISRRTIRSLKAEKPHLFEDSLEPGTVDETGEFTLSNYHVIYKSKKPENGTIILPPTGYPQIFNQVLTKNNPPARDRLKRTTANIVYPEILAVLDYDKSFTTIYEYRFLNLLMYTISFWNTVNHRYESLKNPEIRLRLTGIAVLMNRKNVKLIRHATVGNDLNAHKIISSLQTWLRSKIQRQYDIVAFQTNKDLCTVEVGQNECKRDGLLGLAFVGALCSWGQNYMAAAIHDDYHDSGVGIAAHEVGHILGARHDKENSPPECIDTKGYIMTWNANYNDRQYEWSRCSKENITNHLQKKLSACLDNDTPSGDDQGDLVDELILSGRIEPDYQCRQKGYTKACESDNICENLSCKWWFCSNLGPALEGTPCPGGICHNGKCVAK